MVAFTTLFLGLVLGSQTVGVTVGEPVAAVEIFLDGEPCGTLRQEPFRLQCDFGEELSPHRLVAVAADVEGKELGRAEQWVNLPRQPAETTLALARDPSGRSTVATLSWGSLGGAPSAIRAQLDGRPIEVDDPSRILLPAHDPQQLHLLRVEIDFGDTLSSAAEVVFGGAYGDEVATEITAVPIVHSKGKPPAAADLAGWFVKRGEVLEVAAVDRGPIDLVVVRDLGAQPDLMRIWRYAPGEISLSPPGNPDVDREGQPRIEFLWPVSTRRGTGEGSVDLFIHSRRFFGRQAELPPLLLHVQAPAHSGKQRIADALAVAGVTAAAGNNRRGVVLVVSRGAVDGSDISAEQARRYLERLSVPLEVWTVDRHGAPPHAWPEAIDASNFSRIRLASRRLLKELGRQSVVWLEGNHLPNEIELSELAKGVRIAGRSEPGR